MKTVMITGTNRGLGAALVREFYLCPFGEYRIIGHSRKYNNVNNQDIDYCEICGDLRDENTISKLVTNADRCDLDILINNAAIYSNLTIEEMTKEQYKEVIEVNLLSVINLTSAIWSILKRKKSGLIININSHAGKEGRFGESAYVASKFGLRGFSESIREEGIKHNISVIDVYVGAIKTDMTRARKDWKKLIDPNEVAGAIVLFCTKYQSMDIAEITINRSKYQ